MWEGDVYDASAYGICVPYMLKMLIAGKIGTEIKRDKKELFGFSTSLWTLSI
ncbi:hypothetical protein [Bartonella jaculi]|uniref:Uncharacterized protein n=1 Tax=Bartonella jaculi TaxID=686226 RepID=A0ABP9N1Z6_9HYPH